MIRSKITSASTSLLFVILIFIGVSTDIIKAGTFVDDVGREFNFVGKPRVGVRAGVGGVSLYHLGMREDQMKVIWGLWSIRGSDLDIDNPEAGSRYPESDPNVEEVNFFKKMINISPSCHTNPRGCFRWDNMTILTEVKSEIDYILFIDNGGDSGMKVATAETGLPVVFIDTFYERNELCRFQNYSYVDKKNCFGRSMIDIALRIEELAIAMNVNIDQDQLNREKRAASEAAQTFTQTMKRKQEEGVRFITSINAIKKDDNGTDVFEFRTLDPIDLWVPRTLEELGMPIMHHDEGSQTLEDISTRVRSPEYFQDCPEGQISKDCNSNTTYPIDFWLFDSRSYLNIIGVDTPTLEGLFPDKAILAGQHWHYSRNDGPISYNVIARMLNEMTKRTKDAKRLHPKTNCTNVDPKTGVTAQIGGGLDRGEYICYDESLIQTKYLSGLTIATSAAFSSFGYCTWIIWMMGLCSTVF